MSSKSLNEDLFDVLLEHAAKEYSESEVEQFLSQTDEAPIIFSSDYERKTNILLRQERKDSFKKKLAKVSKIASIFIVCIFVGSAILISSVKAFRISFFNMFYNDTGTHVDIGKEEITDGKILKELPQGWTIAYEPTYIPSGFTVSSISTAPLSITYEYKNAEGKEMSFIENNFIGQQQADSEHSNFKRVKVGQYDGFTVIGNGLSTLSWNDGNYSYLITGELDIDELMKIAESLKSISD